MFSRTRTAPLEGDCAGSSGLLSEMRESMATALVETLGNAGAKVTMNYVGLSESFDAKKMHTKLVELFGAGAASLEVAMLTKFYGKLGLKFAPDGSRTFVDYVSEGKRLSDARQLAAVPRAPGSHASAWRLFRK